MSPIITAILVSLVGLGCVVAVLLGLPGTWMFLALAVGVELTDTWWAGPDTITFGWPVILTGVFLAIVAEVIEFLSGSWGSRLGGGSRRASVGALLGGLVGGILGTLMLPIIGTILGALGGTFLGAYVGETTGPDALDRKAAVKPAFTATLGRIIGLVAKLSLSITIWLGTSVAAIYRAWPF